jgi:hypothetical protein
MPIDNDRVSDNHLQLVTGLLCLILQWRPDSFSVRAASFKKQANLPFMC